MLGCSDLIFLPTNGLSIKPLKVNFFAGEQNATESMFFGKVQVFGVCLVRYLFVSAFSSTGMEVDGEPGGSG